MKTHFTYLTAIIFIVVIVGAGSLNLNSDDQFYPVAVSPGLEMDIAMVGESCPTFSWTGVQGSTGYKLKVFETATARVITYHEMEAMAQPVINKEFQGTALSWTPNWNEGMNTGAMYIWYVAAVDAYGQERWSEGRLFKVELSPMLKGIEERLKKTLKKCGASKDTVDEIFKGAGSEGEKIIVPGSVFITNESNPSARIQGSESGSNTLFGLRAGSSITNGNCNTLIGCGAGSDNTVGCQNTFIGHHSGNQNIYGFYNTFVGAGSGLNNTLGEQNTFIGYGAGYDNLMGHYNTFLGCVAGRNNTNGVENTFLGHGAGYKNSLGNYNTFLGYKAGFKNKLGEGNTYIGRAAGYEHSSGQHNTYLGYCAGRNKTNGEGNTFLGYASGYNNVSGYRNLFLGYRAGYNETGSDKLYIDNTDTSDPLIYGEFDTNIVGINGRLGIGTENPTADIEVTRSGAAAIFKISQAGGSTFKLAAGSSNVQIGSVSNHGIKYMAGGSWKMQLNPDGTLTMSDGGSYNGTWNNASSRELKENIEVISSSEAFSTLENLEPVKYNYKQDKKELHAGFIAEDVPELVATNSRKNISTMDIVAVLTKVVKEQQKVINQLNERIKKLENK
jgi:hypothetical protein